MWLLLPSPAKSTAEPSTAQSSVTLSWGPEVASLPFPRGEQVHTRSSPQTSLHFAFPKKAQALSHGGWRGRLASPCRYSSLQNLGGGRP